MKCVVAEKYPYLPYRRDFCLKLPPPLWKFQLSFISLIFLSFRTPPPENFSCFCGWSVDIFWNWRVSILVVWISAISSLYSRAPLGGKGRGGWNSDYHTHPKDGDCSGSFLRWKRMLTMMLFQKISTGIPWGLFLVSTTPLEIYTPLPVGGYGYILEPHSQ